MARQTGLLSLYEGLKKQVKTGFYSIQTSEILTEIYSESLSFLATKNRLPLTSRVADKEYFAFVDENKMSRAINHSLYNPECDKWQSFREAMRSEDISRFSAEDIQKILYTMAISFCAAIDLIKDGDQKTPGTFFEYFVAHFFTWRVGVEPSNSIKILKFDDIESTLPTDFIFNLGQ